MFPAEGADSVNDLVHLPQGYSVHALVEFIKGCLDGVVVKAVAFVIYDLLPHHAITIA